MSEENYNIDELRFRVIGVFVDSQTLLYNHRRRVLFNPKEAHLLWIANDWSRDGDILVLAHEEFERLNPGEITQVFWLDQAKVKFPFLFYDTNPILYRRF